MGDGDVQLLSYARGMDYRSPAPEAPLLVVAGSVVALDRTTGKELWVYKLDRVTRRFAIVENRVFVFDGDGVLHCLDIPSGKLLGKVDVGMTGAKSMLVDGDRMYVTDEYRVAALDLNGAILWKVEIPGNSSHGLPGLAVVGGNILQPDYNA